jgi:ketosteroid isomerase-like protein
MRRLLSLLLLSLCISGAVYAQASSKDDAALKNVVRQVLDAQIGYDAKKLDSLFTSDYIEISPVGEFDPRAKVLGFYAPDQKPPPALSVTVEDTEYSIRNYGKYAVVITRLNYLMSMDGKAAPTRSIRATYVIRREKDSWKVASAQYTGIRPAIAPQK